VQTYVIYLRGYVNPFMVFLPFQAGFTAGPVAGRRPSGAVFRGVDGAVAVDYTHSKSFDGSAMILSMVMV
jgi:hypothetical protein